MRSFREDLAGKAAVQDRVQSVEAGAMEPRTRQHEMLEVGETTQAFP